MHHLLSFCLCSVGALLAQAPQPAAKPVEGTPRPTSDALRWTDPVHSTGENGALHTAGSSYLARFDATGATFVPFLGSTAECEWPATFRLAAAHIGARALPVAAAEPRRDGDVILFDRGCTLEQYATSLTGIEQRFVFSSLPERGELRLRIAVASALQAGVADDGIRFTGPLGGVRYGKAIAIDGHGRKVAMTMTLADGGLDLIVPAEFVANAAMPLVVDPVITALQLFDNSTVGLINLDVAWDQSTSEWFAVYEQPFSATNSNVYGIRLSSGGAPVGAVVTFDNTMTSWAKPRIANLASADKFLVVAECDDNVSVPWVSGRTLAVQNGNAVLGATFVVAKSGQGGSPLGAFTNPDVGGDGGSLANGQWCVVYEYGIAPDRDVYLRNFDSNGSLVGGTVLVGATGFDERGPRISRNNGFGNPTSQRWAIAYERRTTTGAGDAAKLWGALVNRDGSLRPLLGANTWVVSDFSVTGRGGWDVSSPTDDVGGFRKLLVVESRPTGTMGLNLFGILFSDVGVGGVPVDITLLEQLSGATTADDQRSPSVDSDGTRFAIGYVRVWSATDRDVFAVTVAGLGNGALVVHDKAIVTSSTDDENEVVMVGRRSGGGPAGRYLVALRRQVGNDHRFLSASYEGLTAGDVSFRTTGCGGLDLTATGTGGLAMQMSFALGNVQGVGGFLAGAPIQLQLTPCPTCFAGTTMDVVIAGTTWDFVIPNNVGLIGLTFAVQGFDVAPVGPCLGQIRASHTADVDVR
jgi:hypothetical protein